MILSEYICELLYRYNCVIIPEFGAFLTQRVPAVIAEESNYFYPPKKKISFNNQIINNDGLLANYIAKGESISYEAANFKIQQFVQEINQELNNKGSISFSEIGFFTINPEQKLTFEPLHTTNYLSESFGLTTLEASEINRIEETSVINEKVIPLTPLKEEEGTKKNNYFLKYAAVGILFLGISGIGVNSYKQKINAYNTQLYVEAENEVKQQLQSASFVFEVDEVLPSIFIEIEKPETNSYHVIAGAFREYRNVTKKLNQLLKKGFDAKYIGKNKYGLHQVTYASFSDKNEAINTLNFLKKTENPSAWLLTLKK